MHIAQLQNVDRTADEAECVRSALTGEPVELRQCHESAAAALPWAPWSSARVASALLHQFQLARAAASAFLIFLQPGKRQPACVSYAGPLEGACEAPVAWCDASPLIGFTMLMHAPLE